MRIFKSGHQYVSPGIDFTIPEGLGSVFFLPGTQGTGSVPDIGDPVAPYPKFSQYQIKPMIVSRKGSVLFFTFRLFGVCRKRQYPGIVKPNIHSVSSDLPFKQRPIVTIDS